MGIIAKTFKADISGNAKGNIEPQDYAVLTGFSLSDNTGILNITASDLQIIGEPTYPTAQKVRLAFRKGYVVIQGRLVLVEENTVVEFNLPASGTSSGYIGIKIDLSQSRENEVTWFQKTDGIITQPLLPNSNSGIYEFVVYSYTATPTSMTINGKTSKIIYNMRDVLNNIQTEYVQKNDIQEYTKLTELTLTSGSIKINDSTTYGGLTMSGYGQLLFNPETGKKYWKGNLHGVRSPDGSASFSMVIFELLFLSLNEYRLVKVIDGGSLSYVRLDSGLHPGVMYDLRNLQSANSIQYIGDSETFYAGANTHIAINNIILEIE